MALPDIDLGMGFLSKLNPFKKTVENLTDTLDTWVDQSTLDKDLANELRTKIHLAQIEGEALAIKLQETQIELQESRLMLREKSHQIALQTTTIPKIDALHKMSRPILSLLSLLIPPLTLITLKYMGVPLTGTEVVAALFGGGGVPAIYSWVKGKGAQIK